MKIRINQISKNYSIKRVLDRINISIVSNSNYCLVGKNGAGKTTLINIMTDFIRADSGEILFNNMTYKNNELEIKQNIGLLSEKNFLIEELSGFEYLTFVGKLYNLPKEEIKSRIESMALYFFDSIDELHKSISIYSSGMKRKLMFCSCVIHKPNILILDEPFSGLDPVSSMLLAEFLNKYKNKDRIIFLSSHNLNYVKKIATHIGVLNDGKMLYDGTLNAFIDGGKEKIDDNLFKLLSSTPSNITGLSWAF